MYLSLNENYGSCAFRNKRINNKNKTNKNKNKTQKYQEERHES